MSEYVFASGAARVTAEVTEIELKRAQRAIDERVVELRRDGYAVEVLSAAASPVASVRLSSFEESVELIIDPLGIAKRARTQLIALLEQNSAAPSSC